MACSVLTDVVTRTRTARVVAYVLGFCLAAPVASAFAATYYVDATAGNDANAGTSPATAWRNAPGMASYTGSGRLVPGDVVLLDRADTWLVTGQQGLYLVGGVTYVGNQWGNGTSRAVLRAAADLASAVVRFRDDAIAETTFRGFDVDANGKVANGIEMNHSFYAGPLTGATKRIDDVVVHSVWSRTSLGQYKYGIIVSNHGGAAGEVANVEILNSIVHDISRDGIPIYPGDESAACIVRNVLIRNTVVYNTGLDPDYGAGAGIIVKGRSIGVTVEYNVVRGTKGAGIFVSGNESNHFGSGPSGIRIRHNIVNVDTVHGSIRLYDPSSGKDPKDVSIYGNLVFGNTRGSGLELGRDLGSTNAIRIYNNAFVNAPVNIDNTLATFSTLAVHNNIFYHATGVPFVDSGRVTAHSNNLYFSGGSVAARSAGRDYGPSTLTTYEASAIGSNPGFVNVTLPPVGFAMTGGRLAPSGDGLAPAAGAPTIDRGAALATEFASSVNGAGRPQGRGWDVGAYELATQAPPSPPTELVAR